MGVLPLAVAVNPCLCQVALGRLKIGFEGERDDDLRVQDAPIRREGEMDGAAGPVMKSIVRYRRQQEEQQGRLEHP